MFPNIFIISVIHKMSFQKVNFDFKRKCVSIEKDFHQYHRIDAITWLIIDIIDFINLGITNFYIIHGYNHGTAIRDYIRNDYKIHFKKLYPTKSISIIPITNGVTLINIKIKC